MLVMVATTMVSYSPVNVASSPSNGLFDMLVAFFLVVATNNENASY